MTEEAGGQTQWPKTFPYLTVLGLVIGLALTGGLIWLKVDRAKPLQKHYIFQYFGTYFYKEFEPQIKKRLPYRVVYMGEFPADNERMERFPDAPLYVATRQFAAAKWNLFLRDFVYEERTPFEWFRWQFIFGGTATLLLFLVGNSADGKRRRRAKEGRIIRGHGFMSRWHYNMFKSAGDGWSVPVANKQNLIEKVLGEKRIHLAKKDIYKHIIGFADTGGGKSTFMREILYQIEEEWLRQQKNPNRKPTGMPQTAVILDPDGEFYREFHRKERGDWNINFKAADCPSYAIGREAADEIEAIPLAHGLLSEGSQKDWWIRHSRAIIAYLEAVYHPTARQLEEWISNEKILNQKLVGSEYEGALEDNASGTRQAILTTLAEIVMGLRMIPGEDEGRRVFCVRDWVKECRGWVFVTSTPVTMAAMAPLQTMILDQIIMRLQAPRPGALPTAILIDELAAYDRPIPQLKTASTRGRKWEVPLIIFTQGVSQIERIYGEKEAQELLSGPTTNIFLRTRDAQAGRRLSDHIGSPEWETITESKQDNSSANGRNSYSTHVGQKPLVIPMELSNRKDLKGYFCQPEVTIPIELIPRPKRVLNATMPERTIPRRQRPVAPDTDPFTATVPAEPKEVPAGGRKTWKKIEGQKEQDQLSLLGVITEK